MTMNWLRNHKNLTSIIYVPVATAGFLLIEVAGLPFILVAFAVIAIVGILLAVFG